jgi:hypothetical protein
MKRRRRRWLERARAILRLAFPALLLICVTGGAELKAQDSIRIEKHFAVPDTGSRISPMLPIVSEYLPNEDYDRWWHEIAECEGLSLPYFYSRVRFFQVNAVHFYDKDRPSLFWGDDGILYVNWAVGQSYILEGLIFVALPHRGEELVIKHEMLHFLLFWNGVPPAGDHHPMPFFGQCGMSITYGGSGGRS